MRLGHRISADFDFFTEHPLNREVLRAAFPLFSSAVVIQDEPNPFNVAFRRRPGVIRARISSPGPMAVRCIIGMLLDFSKLPARDIYGWMSSTIAPRPIAWASTISAEGRTNLAPFSFFQGITSNPPTLMFVPVNNREGQPKDTVRNIQQVPEFVINVVSYALADAMNATAASLPYGESEAEKFGIAMTPPTTVRPPRVTAAPVAFECTLDRIVNIGEGPLAAHVVFGRIQLVHVSDAVLGADGRIDPAKLDLIGRLSGDEYCRTTERFTVKRPD